MSFSLFSAFAIEAAASSAKAVNRCSVPIGSGVSDRTTSVPQTRAFHRDGHGHAVRGDIRSDVVVLVVVETGTELAGTQHLPGWCAGPGEELAPGRGLAVAGGHHHTELLLVVAEEH